MDVIVCVMFSSVHEKTFFVVVSTSSISRLKLNKYDWTCYVGFFLFFSHPTFVTLCWRRNQPCKLCHDVRPVILFVFEFARGNNHLQGIVVHKIQHVVIWPYIIRTMFVWLMSVGN